MNNIILERRFTKDGMEYHIKRKGIPVVHCKEQGKILTLVAENIATRKEISFMISKMESIYYDPKFDILSSKNIEMLKSVLEESGFHNSYDIYAMQCSEYDKRVH